MKNSKHTLSANLVNQLFGTLIFLTVPNILGHTDYAKTVFLAVLMSFLVLSNFGMQFVYGRIMPSIYHERDNQKIEQYNQTFFWFEFIMSFVGSVIIGIIYYIKYEALIESLLIIFLNPLAVIIGFFISQNTVNGDFLVYRNINIKSSFSRLFIIPFAYFFGFFGWIIGQIVSSLFVMKIIKTRVLLGTNRIKLSLIIKHIPEGLILLANFFFWSQLLNSGRFYASVYFDDIIIAQYGLTNTEYTILSSMIIAIYIPVTVEVLKIVKTNPVEAIKQLFNTIIKTSIIIFIVVILAIELSPYLFKIFFPKYDLNIDILKYQLLSLMAFPLIATLGNIFLGLQNPLRLLVIYAISFGISYLVMNTAFESFGAISPAFAQCVGVNLMGIIMLIATIIFYGNLIDKKYSKGIRLLGVIFLPYTLYFLIRSVI